MFALLALVGVDVSLRDGVGWEVDDWEGLDMSSRRGMYESRKMMMIGETVKMKYYLLSIPRLKCKAQSARLLLYT